MGNKIKTAVIGVGNMGTAHAKALFSNQVAGLELCALCDCDISRHDFCKTVLPQIPLFKDWKTLIDSGIAEAVIIAVPHNLHCDIAEYALKSNLNVVLEKPVDVSVSKAIALNRVAQKSDKVFAMMFNQRTNELYSKARNIVRSGALGELKRSVWIITNWYRTQQYYNSGNWRASWAGEGGGVLLNQAPHNLDLWQWICGMPISVTGYCDVAKYHNIEVEDDATIFVRYKNGATGTFITSTGEYPGTNRLEISGDLGKIVIENGKLKWWKLNMSEREYCFNADNPNYSLKYEYSEISAEKPETAHIGILQNFANAILYNEELISPGTDGIFELSLSNAAYLSSWQGNLSVNLPLDCAEFDRILAEKIKNSNLKKSSPDHEDGEYLPRWHVQW
ncbi:MAG: Gfo/Idh/MocA family oxidoreductase [Clostridia bacterium]|nr:Gfo/Idh/MocA family oxidoreductase [Clostridia bacterium]